MARRLAYRLRRRLCCLRRLGRLVQLRLEVATLDFQFLDSALLLGFVLRFVLRFARYQVGVLGFQPAVLALQFFVLNQHDPVDAIVVAFPYLALCFCMLAPRVGYCEARETLLVWVVTDEWRK